MNAEKSVNGIYTKYPKDLSPHSTEFIGDLVKTFGELVQSDGAQVRINYKHAFTSQGGIWIPPQRENVEVPSAITPTDKKLLPEGKQARFPLADLE